MCPFSHAFKHTSSVRHLLGLPGGQWQMSIVLPAQLVLTVGSAIARTALIAIIRA